MVNDADTARRASLADDGWRLLRLGYSLKSIKRARDIAVLTVAVRDQFGTEFGEFGWIVDAVFGESNRQLGTEQKGVDISALSGGLGWAYATTYRRCKQLEKSGLLTMERDGRRMILSWTDNALHQIMRAHERVERRISSKK